MSAHDTRFASPINLQSPASFTDPLPEQVDVVVIGGGIVGISTALELAERGQQVLVCEKGRVAGEQSSRNWGWIRQTGRDADELPLMVESLSLWKNLASRTGENQLAFSEQGVLYLANNEKEAAEHEAFIELARSHKVDSHILSTEQVKNKLPHSSSAYVNGLWTPSDGRAEPWYAVPALARAAHNKGVQIRENCAVRHIETNNGCISAVITESGLVTTNRVLLAGGAWSSGMARALGVHLPQLSVKATVARLETETDLFSGNQADDELALAQRMDGGYTMALADFQQHTINADSFRYCWPFRFGAIKKWHRTKFHLTAPATYPGSWSEEADRWRQRSKSSTSHGDARPSVYEKNRLLDPQAEPAVIETMLQRLKQNHAHCKNPRITHAWAGLIETMPDFVPVLDMVKSIDGFFIATGFSGHGFGIGPGAGRVMADLMTGNPPGHNLERFRLDRFTDGSKLKLGPI